MGVLHSAIVDYDANARPTKQRLMANGVTHALGQTRYDPLGRVECTAQRMNPDEWESQPNACVPGTASAYGRDRISKTHYSARGQVERVETALGTPEQRDEVRTSYRPNGQVETLTDGESNRTTYEYDDHDRLKKTRFPLQGKGANASSSGIDGDYEDLGRDPAGNVTSRRRRDGQVMLFSYDALNRQTFANLPGGDPDISYGYDNLGRTTQAQDSNGNRVGYGHDALGRVVSEGNYFYTHRSQYDLAGRRTRLEWRDGFFVTYEHDGPVHLSRIRENGGPVLASFGYDNDGRRTSLTRGNGTMTSYGYDPVSRLASMTHDLGGTAHDQTVGFAYNNASQIAAREATNDGYAWTGHGSGTSGSSANGLNQLTQASAVRLAARLGFRVGNSEL